MSLTSISDFCKESNLSGILSFEYAPIDYIDAAAYEMIISDTNNWQYEIPFGVGGWLTAGVLINPRKKLWTETQRANPQGPTWEQLVSGVTPKLRPAVNQQFEMMAHRQFILRITDLNGQTWIVGTLHEPFEFSANATSGNNGAANQYEISFRSINSKRAIGYEPIL